MGTGSNRLGDGNELITPNSVLLANVPIVSISSLFPDKAINSVRKKIDAAPHVQLVRELIDCVFIMIASGPAGQSATDPINMGSANELMPSQNDE